MPTPRTVGENELLFGYIDEVNIIHIYNQAATEPDEKLGIVRKLLSDEVFYLPELERHQARTSVGGHYIGIVPVGRDEHQAVCRDPE